MEMETKTYYAEDMPTAMEQIKRELGVDAIIIKSRKIKQKYGPLGLFRRDMYEVVVSCEPDKALPARAAFARDARRSLPRAADRKEPARKEPARAEPLPAPEEILPRKAEPAYAEPARERPARREEPGRKADQAPAARELLPKRKADRAAERAEDPVNMKNIQPERFAQLLELNASRQETAEEREDMLRVLRTRQDGQPAAVSSSTKLGAYAAAMTERPARVIKPRPEPEPEAEPDIEEEDEIVPGRGLYAEREPEAQAQDATMARLDALEAMMRELRDKMLQDAPKAEARPKPPRKKAEPSASLETLLNMLADQDVDHNALKALEEDARKRMISGKLEAGEALSQALAGLLGKPRCMRPSPKNKKKHQPRCILFVGPTGVGKTTTLVKLASACVFERGARVAIINADVFRVGAQDQLSAYARILDVPVSTIYDSGEIAAAVAGHKDRDFVFIDTSGKAPHDPDYQAELRKLIELGSISEIYLTASSTSSGRVCRQLAKEYDGLGEYRIIVTKLDESGSYGALVNLRYASGRPLSYVTTGQNVPDDIRKAEPGDIIGELLG